MKNRKIRFIILGSISVICISYFIISLITYTSKIKRLKNEQNNLDKDLTVLKANADDLKSEIEKLKDPEYIARFARKAFFYSKEKGEYVIKIDEKEKEKKETITINNKPNISVIFGFCFVFLCIITYIVIKTKKAHRLS